VADNGVGCDIRPVEAEGRVADGLAGAIEADRVYGPYRRVGTVSKITFPVQEFDGVTGVTS
jgi:hypothetical protein